MAHSEENYITSRVFPTTTKGPRPPSTPLQPKTPGVPDASSALSPPARIRKPQSAAGPASPMIPSSVGKENSLLASRGERERELELEPPTETIYEIPKIRSVDRTPLLVPSPVSPSVSSSSSSSSVVVQSAEPTSPILVSKTDEIEAIKREQQKRWITVFGFAPGDRAIVLQQFRNYGEVTKTVFPPNDANWMHIQYLNSFQSGNALTKNGMILNGRIMLGVVECTEKDLPSTSSEPVAPPVAAGPTLSAADILRPQPRSFHAAGRTEYNIEKMPEPGPQAAQSWWSKMREYVIGI